ncbi:MAG: hypothetical protein CMP42_00880 [Rickettsiales bacterium]|nr:hypothetical protein [Rickettsiales bacterium]
MILFFLKFTVFFSQKKSVKIITGINILLKKNITPKNNFRQRRFVLYKGIIEASKVPPEWNAWIHHIEDDVPKAEKKLSWIKNHKPNLTGTPFAYEYKDKKESKKIKNIYTVWSPDE